MTSSKHCFKFKRKTVRNPINSSITNIQLSILPFCLDYDDTFLAGHSLSLFFDGTETSAAALSFVMYELARNPDCQIKIYDEVKKVLSKYDGEVTYGGIQEMNYLECVLNEAIRIHPPALSMVKLCTKSYTLPKLSTQSEPITIQPGTPVQIPILGIHM